MPPPLLVTAALPYANGPLHLGHLAGAYLPADLYARYQRLAGRDVVFVCGSDEHGAAIAIRAMQDGTTPQAVVDRYHEELKSAFGRLGMSFDIYGRTTSAMHRETSQAMFAAIEAAGGFTTRTQRQPFDPEAGMFLADRFVRGTCPVCGYADAYGDQCENCGSTLAPEDLIDPRSALSGATPVERETTHWYLPLGAMQPALQAWIDTRTDWKPNVTGQIRSWLAAGLADRAMTRDLPWGVPVPESAHGDTAGKVLYVWFDAPIGYVSVTREWAEQQGDANLWRRYWQVHEDGDGNPVVPELVHFIGKDNIVFHGLIFPAILQALNAAQAQAATDIAGTFVLPANVPANEFLTLEGQKLSTSRGWAVWAADALDAFPADLLRYALAAGLPETKDADFTWADFQNRANGELADVVGNFANRALTFAARFTDNRVPALDAPAPRDVAALAALGPAVARVGEAYERVRLREAVAETVQLARLGNQFLAEAEPWKTREADPRAMRNAVHVALQITASLSVLLDPVVPDAAARLRAMLNLAGVRASTPGGAPGGLGWADAGRPLLAAGHALGTAAVLFPKVEDAAVDAQRERLASASHPAAASVTEANPDAAIVAPAGGPLASPSPSGFAPLLAEIQFGDVAKLDLRAGRIVAADVVPKADKLLRLDVDLGFETRQVVSGIRAFVSPEEAVGRSVVVVANLAPRVLRGLESRGMILMAEDRDGTLRFVGTDGEPGAAVR